VPTGRSRRLWMDRGRLRSQTGVMNASDNVGYGVVSSSNAWEVTLAELLGDET